MRTMIATAHRKCERERENESFSEMELSRLVCCVYVCEIHSNYTPTSKNNCVETSIYSDVYQVKWTWVCFFYLSRFVCFAAARSLSGVKFWIAYIFSWPMLMWRQQIKVHIVKYLRFYTLDTMEWMFVRIIVPKTKARNETPSFHSNCHPKHM